MLFLPLSLSLSHPPPKSMPYTDRGIGWHLEKRCPVPCYSPCPSQPGQQYYIPHHPGNIVHQEPILVSVPLSCALSSSACSPLHGNTTFPLFHCLHILMGVWIIRSLSRTLISIECLHHCQINVLCSWTALQTVGRCRSSQKHRLTIVIEKWISVMLFRSLVKQITIRRASVSCKWSSLCYSRLQKPCAHPAHLRIKKNHWSALID